MRARLFLLGAALAAALAPTACGSDESVNPDGGVTIPGTGNPDASDAATPPDAGKDAGPVVRTVQTRSRFGALDPDNFLLDGDFEYSGQDAMQYPWFGLDYTWVVTGARCRHGLRCAEIPLRQYIFGTFVWPDSGTVDVEYYAKPSGSGDCTQEVAGIITPLADYPGAPQQNLDVSANDPNPDADGWCHVTANVQVPTDTGNAFWALLVAPPRQTATGSILVDDASIRVPGSASNALAARVDSRMTALVARARADFAKRPPVPPRGLRVQIKNRTARRRLRPH